MENAKIKGIVCYCKACGNLDYAVDRCRKCASRDIQVASEEYYMGVQTHMKLMTYVYDQHSYPKIEKAGG